MGESQNQPFRFSFNRFSRVDFQVSRAISGGSHRRQVILESTFVVLLVAAAFVLRLWELSKMHFWDEASYLQNAEVICCGKTNFSELDFRAPLLSLIFAAVFLLWHNIYAADIVTALLNALGPALLYVSGRMVVPNGTLFGDGVCARIKEELLKEFNLHTIVRLPNGVFAPYTSIPTNLLFFDRSGPTNEIWYYEQPLPETRKTYTKTQPMRFEEFEGCLAWWKKRDVNERAWQVRAEDVVKYDADGNLVSVNLDIKNPQAKQDFEHLLPEKLVEDILAKERRIQELLVDVGKLLGSAL